MLIILHVIHLSNLRNIKLLALTSYKNKKVFHYIRKNILCLNKISKIILCHIVNMIFLEYDLFLYLTIRVYYNNNYPNNNNIYFHLVYFF